MGPHKPLTHSLLVMWMTLLNSGHKRFAGLISCISTSRLRLQLQLGCGSSCTLANPRFLAAEAPDTCRSLAAQADHSLAKSHRPVLNHPAWLPILHASKTPHINPWLPCHKPLTPRAKHQQLLQAWHSAGRFFLFFFFFPTATGLGKSCSRAWLTQPASQRVRQPPAGV